MTQQENIAIDTCIVVDVLFPNPSYPERYEASKELLVEHGKNFSINLSAIVIPELAGIGFIRGGHVKKAERDERIEIVKQWIMGAKYKMWELTPALSIEASRIAIDYQLKGNDAIILSTAIRAQCSTLYTWDNDLLKLNKNEYLAQKITIETPPEPQSLFSI